MLTVKHFVFSPLQENTYVIFNEKGECCILDPGCYTLPERNELKNFISSHGLAPKYLLNTHCHLDHIFGNEFIQKEYGLTLHIHKKEKPVLDYAPASALMWGLPVEPYSGELVYLEEGDTISLGEDCLKVLFTPGHSPGSISFFCEEQNFVISGDVLFRTSIGRTDLPGGDFDTLIHSIRSKLFTLPDGVTVYSGHGPETTIGYEKERNPFLNSFV